MSLDPPDLAARLQASESEELRELGGVLDPEALELQDDPLLLLPLAEALRKHADEVLTWYAPLLPRVQSGAMRGDARRALLEIDAVAGALELALAGNVDLPGCAEEQQAVARARVAVQKWLPQGDRKRHLVAQAYEAPKVTDRDVLARREERKQADAEATIAGGLSRMQWLAVALVAALALAGINAALYALSKKPERIDVPLEQIRTVLPAATDKSLVGGEILEIRVRADWAQLDRGRQMDQVLAAVELTATEGFRQLYVLDPAGRTLMHLDPQGQLHTGAALKVAR